MTGLLLDTAIFILGRVAAIGVRPDTWLIAGVLVTVLALVVARLRLARRAGVITLCALLLIAVLPVGDLALRPLERSHSPAPDVTAPDGILVLGGAQSTHLTRLWGPVQLNEAAERMTETMMLARKHPQARIVFSGGTGALRDVMGGGLTEAQVAARFFEEQGLDSHRLTLEDSARNTAENARFSLQMVAPDDDETWILVTSAFHMPRAIRSFEAAGWPGELIAWPVDHRGEPLRLGWNLTGQMSKLQTALREYLGLFSYRVLGRG